MSSLGSDTLDTQLDRNCSTSYRGCGRGARGGRGGGLKKILLAFSKVPYLNSSGISLVIQLLMAASKVPQKVVCFGLSAHFVKVFTMLGLAKYTTMHADEAAARAAVA